MTLLLIGNLDPNSSSKFSFRDFKSILSRYNFGLFRFLQYDYIDFLKQFNEKIFLHKKKALSNLILQHLAEVEKMRNEKISALIIYLTFSRYQIFVPS